MRWLSLSRLWLFAILAFPAILFAQAGGGGNFGGGSSSSGSGGGGGGGGELVVWLIRFTIAYPQYGIPIWIVIILFFMYLKNTEKSARITRTIRRGRKVQEESLRQSALDQLAVRDPDFDEQAFLNRAQNAFLTTQHAWSEQDLGPCRAFLSDGVHERFELYIAMQKAENIRNRMRDVRVLDQNVVALTSDHHFDTIHVSFVASAISYNEDLTTKRRVSGNSDIHPIQFTETWSFSRRPGAKTNPDASLLQGVCPNCGGPLEIVDRAQCPQCESIINSGRYDWVLAEITQSTEWVVPPAHHQVAGWDELVSKDPGLNFQHLEDRASVIFWRSMMAVYFDDIKYAAPVLAREITSVPIEWNPGQGQFWKTPAVGVVEVVGTKPSQDDSFDRIHVLVRWSATPAQGDRNQPKLLDLQRIYSHVLILKRRSGATSNTDEALTSFSCQNCGAPIDVGKADACQFCGTSLNDGTSDWVLEDVTGFNYMKSFQLEQARDRTIRESGAVDRLERDRLLNEPDLQVALARMVAVDGEIHEKEKQYLTNLLKRRGISLERINQVLTTADADEQPLPLPDNREQLQLFMDHLIRAALIDGRITGKEKRLLRRVCGQMGWSLGDLKAAIYRNREHLYKQARQVIRKPPVIAPGK